MTIVGEKKKMSKLIPPEAYKVKQDAEFYQIVVMYMS